MHCEKKELERAEMIAALNADFPLFHFLGSLQHFSIATHLAINPI